MLVVVVVVMVAVVVMVVVVVVVVVVVDEYNIAIMAQSLREFNQHQTAADPQTKPTDLGCESVCKLLLSTLTVATIILPCHRG